MAITTHFFCLTAFILGIFYSMSAKSNEAEFATKHIASNVILISYQDAPNDTPYQTKDESSSIHYFHSANVPPPQRGILFHRKKKIIVKKWFCGITTLPTRGMYEHK